MDDRDTNRYVSYSSMEILTPGPLEDISRPSSVKSEGRCSSSRAKHVPSYESLSLEVLSCEDDNISDRSLDFSDIRNKLPFARIPNESFDVCSSSCQLSADKNDLESLTDSEDPEIREGVEQIFKLDKLLSKRVTEERTAKAERRALSRQMKDDLEQLITENKSGKFSVEQKLLALIYSPGDANEEKRSESLIKEEFKSIFATQLDQSFEGSNIDRSEVNSEIDIEMSPSKTSSTKSKSKHKKDFLKRNKELAANAADIIPMTKEEKRRLNELLSDSSDLLLEENAFTLKNLPAKTIGYTYTDADNKAITEIDTRLKELLPDNQINSICYSLDNENIKENERFSNLRDNEDRNLTQNIPPKNDKECLTKSDIFSEVDNDISIDSKPRAFTNEHGHLQQFCGEKVLEEERIMRTLKQKLAIIEEKLNDFNDELGSSRCSDNSSISYDLLQHLIYNDSRSTSTCETSCSESVDVESVLIS